VENCGIYVGFYVIFPDPQASDRPLRLRKRLGQFSSVAYKLASVSQSLILNWPCNHQDDALPFLGTTFWQHHGANDGKANQDRCHDLGTKVAQPIRRRGGEFVSLVSSRLPFTFAP